MGGVHFLNHCVDYLPILNWQLRGATASFIVLTHDSLIDKVYLPNQFKFSVADAYFELGHQEECPTMCFSSEEEEDTDQADIRNRE